MSMIPARQERGKVVMEGARGYWADGRGRTRKGYRDRTRYQELRGYHVSLFVLYLWLVS